MVRVCDMLGTPLISLPKDKAAMFSSTGIPVQLVIVCPHRRINNNSKKTGGRLLLCFKVGDKSKLRSTLRNVCCVPSVTFIHVK